MIVLGKEMCSASSLEAEIDYVKYRLVSWETPHLQRTKYICNSDEKFVFKKINPELAVKNNVKLLET